MTTNRRLDQIIENINATKEMASVDMASVPYNNQPSVAIAKMDAETRLKALKDEYRQSVADKVATIFLIGSDGAQQDFARLAEEEGETLTVTVDAAFRKMAADVEPSIGAGRQFGSTQANQLVRSLEEVGRAAGVEFMPVPRLMDVVTVKTFEDTVREVRNLVVGQSSKTVGLKYLEYKIADLALEEGFEEKVVPVVITGSTDVRQAHEDMKTIYSGTGVVVTIPEGKKVDKEFVLEAFKRLGDKIAKKQQQTNK